MEVCHIIQCEPCILSKPRTCPCGKSYHQLPCSEETPTCGDTCGKVLECGLHICNQRCHKDKCGVVSTSNHHILIKDIHPVLLPLFKLSDHLVEGCPPIAFHGGLFIIFLSSCCFVCWQDGLPYSTLMLQFSQQYVYFSFYDPIFIWFSIVSCYIPLY